MFRRLIPAVLAVVITSCNSVGKEMNNIVICPADSAEYVKSLIGAPIPENREQLELAIIERSLSSEVYETAKARSPFCDKSVSGNLSIQIHFPLLKKEQIKPLLKFYFDDQENVIAVEELAQRRAPSLSVNDD